MGYRKIPSLNWLRVFEAAAETESFSAAARLLNMSPSAVSQQINALEHHLDAKLFHRGPKNVRLAEAGHLFLPTVRQALSSVEVTAASIFGLDERARLNILAHTIFATSWLAPRLPVFEARHPEIGLSITCLDHFPAIGPESADVVVSFGPAAWDWGETARLMTESVFPVATPEIARKIESPSDLRRHKLIEVSGHRQSWLLLLGNPPDEAADALDFSFVSTTALALSMAAAGSGIALARAPATDWLSEKLGLARCLEDLSIGGEGAYQVAIRPGGSGHHGAALFKNWILEEAAKSSASYI